VGTPHSPQFFLGIILKICIPESAIDHNLRLEETSPRKRMK
jgi:hypothetical protein